VSAEGQEQAPRRKPGPGPKIKTLPAGIREELDRRLLAGNFTSYRGLCKWLSEQGCELSTPTLWRYGNKLERRLEAVKLATVQARAIVEASPDDDDRINQALIRLVQQHLFTVLVELKSDRLNGTNLAALARSVAEIARTAVMQKKAAEDIRNAMREKLGAAENTVVGAARAAAAEGGLTPEAERQIRRTLMEIAE
jgi:hypothetical protein